MSPHIQHLLVTAMSDWYLGSEPHDPSKALSILEMARELKVLPSILAANKFPFIIELGCWAAKMDFVKLDKWVADKVWEYKVRCVIVCALLVVQELKCICNICIISIECLCCPALHNGLSPLSHLASTCTFKSVPGTILSLQ